MSARILVVRHGQTGGNKNRYVGWEDEPLDDTGRAQAQAVAQALRDEPLDALYCSPLSRARDTAAPLAQLRGLPVQVRDELKEIDYGSYQGLLKTDQPLKLRHDHRFERMPGGESLHDVYLRIERVAEELRAAASAAGNIAVFGHFWSNRMLVGVLLGVTFEALFEQTRYKPANGSIYEVALARDGARVKAAGTRWLLQPGGEGGE